MKNITLGGWQRLGILLSVLWAISVGIAAAIRPNVSPISELLYGCRGSGELLCQSPSVNPVTAAVVIAVPILLLWAVGAVVRWVGIGFKAPGGTS